MIENPTNKDFFTEKRYADNCMRVRKTKNKSKSGNTGEVFRIDNKGRKCSILVPEGADKKGWKTFLSFITFTPDWILKRPRSSLSKSIEAHHISSSDFETPKKSYAEVLLDNNEDEKKRSKCSSDKSSSKQHPAFENKRKGHSQGPLNLKDAVIITKRYFHDDWSKIMFS